MSFQEIEGGFWGILGADGARYVPVEPVPDAFRRDGMAVVVELRPANVLGITMWGTYVHVDDMEAA